MKQAGFDAVEVLSGTGYLISEFLSPFTNRRTDRYGGSLENRMRFGLEVMAAVRNAVGEDFPLVVRMNGNDFMPGGNGRLELQAYARALATGPVDALCINVGWHEARVPQIVTSVPRGVFAYPAKAIREQVAVPVIASHRINDPATAREMIAGTIPADTVVLAAGAASYNPLQAAMEALGIAFQVVGDADKVALAFDAVHLGFRAGNAV